MDWSTPFVIYRVSADGKLSQVYQAQDMKDAKYWLTYIAQVGDVLCKTPSHPKHSKQSPSPEYWSHKEQSGKPATDEQRWRDLANTKNWDKVFPDGQQS